MKTSSFRPHRAERGFTLVEILIVVAIIGILASVALIGLGPVQKRGRDARRISDLRETQSAIELYYSKCGYYPGTPQAGPDCTAFASINGAAAWASLQATLATPGSSLGVSRIPNDPSAGKTYYYGSDGTGTTYVIGATMEDVNNSVLKDDIDGSVLGVSCDDPIYCVQL